MRSTTIASPPAATACSKAFGCSGRADRPRCSPPDLACRLRADLAQVYPELAGIGITHAWVGEMGFARHRMPVVIALEPELRVTTGFAGHGLNTTMMAGERLASTLLEGGDA